MAFQSAPNMAEAVYVGSKNGKNPLSVLNFLFTTGGYTQTDITNLALAVDEWAGTELRPLMSGECAYVRTDVRGLEDANDFFASADVNAGVGALGGENLSAQVTWAVKFTSGLTGRSARGRNYVWFLESTSLGSDENTMDTGRAGQIVDAFFALNGYTSAVGWEHVILSRFTANAPRTVGVAFVVNGYSYTDLVVDTQRRRLRS